MADISTYKDAGVDIDKADAFIKSIRPLVKSTYRTGVLGEIGSFGGMFHLGADRYRDPVLVSVHRWGGDQDQDRHPDEPP